VDRSTPKHRYLNREYIQPQWVYDCINNKFLIPTDKYAPGETLPPHLSPWHNYESDGYTTPWKIKLDKMKEIFESGGVFLETNDGIEDSTTNEEEVEELDQEEEEEEIDEENLVEQIYETELKKELSGKEYNEEESIKLSNRVAEKRKKSQEKKVLEDSKQKEADSMALLSNKDRKSLLYQKYQDSRLQKKGEILVQKRIEADSKEKVKQKSKKARTK